MMVNRLLLHLAVQQGLPQRAVMHDWWFALIASALGEIGFVPKATILYRQHQSNQVGAKNAGSFRYNLAGSIITMLPIVRLYPFLQRYFVTA